MSSHRIYSIYNSHGNINLWYPFNIHLVATII